MSQHYKIDFHAALQQWMLYLDAGTDPRDGSPLTYATALTPTEAVLWQQGETARVELALRGRGIPIPGRNNFRVNPFRAFLRKLRRKLLRGR